MDEEKLIERLRLVEALHAGATTPGERVAAARARERIIERLKLLSSIFYVEPIIQLMI